MHYDGAEYGFKSPTDALKALKDVTDEVTKLKARGDASEATEKIEKLEGTLDAAQKTLAEHDNKLKAFGTAGLFGSGGRDGKGALGGVFVPKSVKERGRQAVQEFVVSEPVKSDSHREYMEVSDAFCIASSAAKRQGVYESFLKTSPIAAEYGARTAEMLKAMDTQTTDTGIEWVSPATMSSMFVDKVRDASFVYTMFPANFTMSTETYKFPRLDADATVYAVSESTIDVSTVIPASNLTSGVATFTLGKLAGRVLFSTESVENMTVQIANVIAGNLARKIGDAIDENFYNGDTTATHMDTDYEALGPTDRRTRFKGIRKYSLANSYTTSGGGNAITDADVLAAIKSMGQWAGGRASTGGGVVVSPSWPAYFDLVGSTNVVTREKYGDAAGILTGEVAKVYGKTVIPSEFMRTGLNASGVDDGITATMTGCILFNLSAFALGTGRSVTIKSSDSRHIETDQIVTVATWRGDFQPLVDITANEACHFIYNVLTG